MKCKNKEVEVYGIVYLDQSGKFYPQKFRCICTNDKKGKTLSIDNGALQFSVPMDDLAKYFTEDEI